MNQLQTRWVRGLLALLILAQAVSFLFATVLTLAYRLRGLEVASFLGGFTPGDDFRRFIPLMEATPWWVHGLWVAASALFLVAAWLLLRNRGAAFPVFAGGWILGNVGNLISSRTPEYRQAFSFAEPLFARDVLIPAVTALVPLLIAAALWAYHRRSLDPVPNQGA